MYSQVSFDPVAQVNRLAESAFGLTLASVPWERLPGFTDWLMSFMAPDGSTIDFSDAWAKRGWGTFMPLLAHMADPVSGGFTQEPDPCFAERFFANKYYDHGLADPWKVDLALARDWQTIVSGCDEDLAREGVEVSAGRTAAGASRGSGCRARRRSPPRRRGGPAASARPTRSCSP